MNLKLIILTVMAVKHLVDRCTGSMTNVFANTAASRYVRQSLNFCAYKASSEQVWRYCTEIFDYLSLSAIIDGKIFCVHGGLSPSIQVRCCNVPFTQRC